MWPWLMNRTCCRPLMRSVVDQGVLRGSSAGLCGAHTLPPIRGRHSKPALVHPSLLSAAGFRRLLVLH